MRRLCLVLALLPATAAAQRPAFDPAVATPDDAPVGQQHWVAVHLSLFQPTQLRVQATVARGERASLAVEAFGGSELVEFMYGFGGRLLWTALHDGVDDALMVSPGLGVHFLPEKGRRFEYALWDGLVYRNSPRTPRTYLAADVDISWVHQFAPHFAWEMGLKLGLAAKVGGEWGKDRIPVQRSLMFGKDLYPLANVFWGFRF
ncbi:MAG: hypothetical protein K2W96_12065 [Gemmataceae bacterium]|nr:hypothetical protein [Gemmataceae bacterium]